jgi:hypothetical protein
MKCSLSHFAENTYCSNFPDPFRGNRSEKRDMSVLYVSMQGLPIMINTKEYIINSLMVEMAQRYLRLQNLFPSAKAFWKTTYAATLNFDKNWKRSKEYLTFQEKKIASCGTICDSVRTDERNSRAHQCFLVVTLV